MKFGKLINTTSSLLLAMAWGDDPENSILVLDDDPGICNALDRILSIKYKVSTANTIVDADALLHSRKFGIIIIDYNLRDRMDGIKFAEYVKTISPLTYTIMLTGNSDFSIVKKALNEQNIDKFMIKPFEAPDLLATVDIAQSDYSSKKEVADMLQSDDGVKMAQNLLTQVFDETVEMEEKTVDLAGLVVSRNSIPVYSKFFDSGYLKKFTDTIFSGFMTAIHMVGEEVFNRSHPVNTVKFGEISIYFKFYQQYQFCYIVRHSLDQNAPNQFKVFDDFFDEIVELLEEDPQFFSVNKDYMQELDRRILKLKDIALVPS